MNFLQKAIGLRGYGQKDPLTEYKLLGYRQYLQMTDEVRRNVIYNVLTFNPMQAKQATLNAAQSSQKAAKAGKQQKKPVSAWPEDCNLSV